jgi:LacI family transcriptional regulator, galactose operon repressor
MGKINHITKKDVAERAGVSTATVSYVINNGPRPVATETRARVLKAIEELGYYPDELARSLAVRKTLTIGFVIPDLNNPYYANLARQFEANCFSNGYMVFVCDTHRDEGKEIRIAESLRSKKVDGVAFLPDTGSLKAVHILERAGIATVVMEQEDSGLHCVAIDDFNGGVIGTNHLLELGHRRIAFINQESFTTSMRRFDGYKYAHEQAGLELRSDYMIACGHEFNDGIAAMNVLLSLSDRPTAVFAHNDVIALNVMHAIREAGFSIPADLSVVGFDDIDEASISQPPLTTISYPKSTMASWAAQRLFELINDYNITRTHKLLPTSLIIRRSTGDPTKTD